MAIRKFIATTIREYLNENINIGDNTNYGVILDKTDAPIVDEPMINKGQISPNYVISAFANPISTKKKQKNILMKWNIK